jgi:hypothetical protein
VAADAGSALLVVARLALLKARSAACELSLLSHFAVVDRHAQPRTLRECKRREEKKGSGVSERESANAAKHTTNRNMDVTDLNRRVS